MRNILYYIIILNLFSLPLNLYSQLIWSTYLGGDSLDQTININCDSEGNPVIYGNTRSINFPITPGAYIDNFIYNGSFEYFITKLTSNGCNIIFSSFIGTTEHDLYFSVNNSSAIDKSSNTYIISSANNRYPITQWISDSTELRAENNVIVTKIKYDGTALIYSSFIGHGFSYGIAVDTAGLTSITGMIGAGNWYPVTTGAYDTTHRGTSFVSKINFDGSGLVYSTFFGVINTVLTIDVSGNSYITSEAGINFPTTSGSYDTGPKNSTIGITKFNSSGSGLVYSTYLGFGDSYSEEIKTDEYGNAYITGYLATNNFPTTPGAFDVSYNGHNDLFVTKINSSGDALIYSSFLGGDWFDNFADLTIDKNNNAYIVGYTSSFDFPFTKNAFYTYKPYTFFLTIFDSAGSNLILSTPLGYIDQIIPPFRIGNINIALDKYSNIYTSSGPVDSANSIITPWAYDTSYNGGADLLVSKYGQCNGIPALQSIGDIVFNPFSCDLFQLDTFYIHNTGSCFLIINNIIFTGSDSSLFSIINTPSDYSTVSANDSVPIIIKFTPSVQGGIKKAILNINNNSADNIKQISLTAYQTSFTINNQDSDTIYIDLSNICTDIDKDTTITLTNKFFKGTTFKIENKDPQLQITPVGKTGKKEGDNPLKSQKRKLKKKAR
jgi:hypothetical protein